MLMAGKSRVEDGNDLPAIESDRGSESRYGPSDADRSEDRRGYGGTNKVKAAMAVRTVLRLELMKRS